MTKFVNATEAVKLIKDKDTVGISGSGGCGSPEGLLKALEERYQLESHPKKITITSGISPGNASFDNVGLNHLTGEGLVARAICAHFGMPKAFEKSALNNQFSAYALPLGVYGHLLRAIAGHKPGVITKVGLQTFIDPCLEGGKLNKKARKEHLNLISLYNINFEDYLFYKAFPINVALIKASFTDKFGNVSLIDEACLGEQKELASAVHNSGGIVICEVEKKVKEIKAQDLVIHKSLVDYIVINKPNKKYGDFNWPNPHPELTGKEPIKLDQIKEMEFNERKICGRRALLEIKPNTVINLGIGMPEAVSMVAKEENVFQNFTLSVEMGPLGGIPVKGVGFGSSINPECLNSTTDTFDLYDGGYLDLAILGLAQVDKYGNVNVSKFKNRLTGPGGFINITQSTKKLIFLGTFTSKNGEKKFINNVEQITFSGKRALKNNQEVLYITEKAVFKLIKKGLELIEIAPNIDLQNDILNNMEFKPLVSKNLKTMDEKIFKKEKMKIEKNFKEGLKDEK